MQPDSILIVDFGSQVTQLIARRVREAGVYSEIAPFSSAMDAYRRLKPKGIILSGGRHQVWMSHGDKIEAMPPGFRVVGQSQGSPLAATAHDEKKMFGLQFHPEVAHTPDGGKLIANFVRHVCGLSGDWTMAEFRATKIAE